MKPKFKDMKAWEQAQLLMQPAFIRVVDNLGKQVELSPWEASYQEIQEPYPGYQLSLTREGHSLTVDIWDLCFQICFANYYPTGEMPDSISQEVEIDVSLFNEQGEVDWQKLERKTQALVQKILSIKL
jgi:hypothetical protein